MRSDTSKGSVVLSQRPPRIPRYAIRAATVAGIVWLAACPRSITDSGFTLSVAPPAANLFVNDSLQLTAALEDGGGIPVPTTYTWSSGDPSVASVDANGLVHGISAGSVTIRVTARGEEASATLTVVVDRANPPSLCA